MALTAEEEREYQELKALAAQLPDDEPAVSAPAAAPASARKLPKPPARRGAAVYPSAAAVAEQWDDPDLRQVLGPAGFLERLMGSQQSAIDEPFEQLRGFNRPIRQSIGDVDSGVGRIARNIVRGGEKAIAGIPAMAEQAYDYVTAPLPAPARPVITGNDTLDTIANTGGPMLARAGSAIPKALNELLVQPFAHKSERAGELAAEEGSIPAGILAALFEDPVGTAMSVTPALGAKSLAMRGARRFAPALAERAGLPESFMRRIGAEPALEGQTLQGTLRDVPTEELLGRRLGPEAAPAEPVAMTPEQTLQRMQRLIGNPEAARASSVPGGLMRDSYAPAPVEPAPQPQVTTPPAWRSVPEALRRDAVRQPRPPAPEPAPAEPVSAPAEAPIDDAYFQRITKEYGEAPAPKVQELEGRIADLEKQLTQQQPPAQAAEPSPAPRQLPVKPEAAAAEAPRKMPKREAAPPPPEQLPAPSDWDAPVQDLTEPQAQPPFSEAPARPGQPEAASPARDLGVRLAQEMFHRRRTDPRARFKPGEYPDPANAEAWEAFDQEYARLEALPASETRRGLPRRDPSPSRAPSRSGAPRR
jgi:hypothetical protein